MSNVQSARRNAQRQEPGAMRNAQCTMHNHYANCAIFIFMYFHTCSRARARACARARAPARA
eukprot:8112276-Lingulodinium_polyedra.AAC.1